MLCIHFKIKMAEVHGTKLKIKYNKVSANIAPS